MRLEVRELNPLDEKALLESFKAYSNEEFDLLSFEFKPGDNFKEHLLRLQKNKMGVDLAPGKVASTMLYGFLDDIIIGRISIRHELNDFLYNEGGHIGYAVIPEFQRKGFASDMVRAALKYCKDILHLDQVLITCDDDNTASIRIIEKFGGVLENKHVSNNGQEITRRYWVQL